MRSAPELFGLHLGMTPDEVRAIVPTIQFGRPDELAVIKTTVNPHFDPPLNTPAFADVRTMSFDFLDGKLVNLWIGYEETFKWPKLDDFIVNFSKALGTPSSWELKKSGRQLACHDFSIFAALIAGGPSIRLTDENAQNTIAQRREEAVTAAEARVIADSRTKIYYPSDCEGGRDIPVESRLVFKNKEEAETAGYKLAKDCQ